MKDRRTFLKEVCPTVAFAFFGISFLEACSADSLEDDTNTQTTPQNDNGGSSDSGDNSGNGFTKNGSTYTIDLTHSNFSSKLSNVGNWMNGQSLGIPALFLRISSDEIKAYTNICPHNNQQNQWSYQSANNRFKCDVHGNSYPDDCNSAGSDGNRLKCYNSSLSGDELTVTIS